jgi:T5SS/PEP-CTERM-associated repeat protein
MLTIADAAGSQGAVTIAGGTGLNVAQTTLRVCSEGAGSLTIEGATTKPRAATMTSRRTADSAGRSRWSTAVWR